MAQHDVAYFREQGQNLVVVMVHWADIQSIRSRGHVRLRQTACRKCWPCGENCHLLAIRWTSALFGLPDLVRFLAKVPYYRIPWNRKLMIP
jgi:hypothetical protein